MSNRSYVLTVRRDNMNTSKYPDTDRSRELEELHRKCFPEGQNVDMSKVHFDRTKPFEKFSLYKFVPVKYSNDSND